MLVDSALLERGSSESALEFVRGPSLTTARLNIQALSRWTSHLILILASSHDGVGADASWTRLHLPLCKSEDNSKNTESIDLGGG